MERTSHFNMNHSLLSGAHKALMASTSFYFNNGEFPLNILDHLAILIIEFFSFQMNMFARLFFMFIMFPFQILSRIRYIYKESVFSILTSFIYKKIETKKSIVTMGVRFCWAFLSAIYVWFILVGMLLSGFMISGFMMKHVVKQPVEVREILNFDYTMASPMAVVPISSSMGLGNHKLQLTVSLTMPESEYNRKLGVFQVRIDFLSTTGKTITSASYPCMLQFKSPPVRVAETILKSVPLMTGFQTEVQKLNIKFDELGEQKGPTGSIRAVLEQRAEFKHAGGIPEVYSASLHLRSKLPRIKQILWAWKISVFVWISIMLFLTQLQLVVLTFCRATLTKAMKQKKIS